MSSISPALRTGTGADVDACVALWVAACGARDGEFVAGVDERARQKFGHEVAWVLAERRDATVAGFALATAPGSGLATDPSGATVLGLLAVDPQEQRSGVGGRLLVAITAAVASRGHSQLVLHALTDNVPALRLYEKSGWVPYRDPFEHSLLKRPMQTYLLNLR
ncbi:MAG: GNAT family N-acetyltransferase [Acidobacteria bacterium]|nr:GNAT family N-acetyltransferase [Acidobacteriota bacterium]